MSTVLMGKCWPIQGLSGTQKSVLISLADQANDEGVCWPAVASVGKRCCLSERAVRTAMNHLESIGLLVRDRRYNSSTVYTVTPDANGAAPRAGLHPVQPAPRAGGAAPRAGRAASGAGLGLHGMPPNHHGTINEPSNEPPFPADASQSTGGDLLVPPKVDVEQEMQEACRATWKAYAAAYKARYSAAPVRNARINTSIRQLVKRLGRVEAPLVAEWYLSVNDARVTGEGHSVGMLLAKAEAYRTQWFTGQSMTQTRARQIDQQQANASVVGEVMALRRARQQQGEIIDVEAF